MSYVYLDSILTLNDKKMMSYLYHFCLAIHQSGLYSGPSNHNQITGYPQWPRVPKKHHLSLDFITFASGNFDVKYNFLWQWFFSSSWKTRSLFFKLVVSTYNTLLLTSMLLFRIQIQSTKLRFQVMFRYCCDCRVCRRFLNGDFSNCISGL